MVGRGHQQQEQEKWEQEILKDLRSWLAIAFRSHQVVWRTPAVCDGRVHPHLQSSAVGETIILLALPHRLH